MTFALAVLLLTVQTPAAPPAKLAASIARVFGPATRVDTLLVDTVRSVYPADEHDQFIAHLRGLTGLWVGDESSRLRS